MKVDKMVKQDSLLTDICSYLNNDKKCVLVTLHLYIILCKNMLAATVSQVHTYNSLLNSLIIVFMGICYLWVFVSERRIKIPKLTVFVTMILFLYFFVSWLFNPDLFLNEGVREQLKSFFAYCFPLFFVISMIEDYDSLFYMLQKYVYIPFIFSIIGFVFSLQFLTSTISYSMSYGYSVLFINSIYLFKYNIYRRKKSLIPFIVTTLFILIAGSRGPIVYIIVSLFTLFLTNNFNYRKLLLSFVGIVLFTILFFYSDVILEWFTSFLSGYGVHSRTLSMLMNNSIAYDSGRAAIHESLIFLINQSPIWGLGAFGAAYHVYLAHSFFLDTFACFGYVGGSIILLIIFYNDYISIKRSWNSPTAFFILMLSVLSFAGGFFSDSFFEKKELWMLLGILIGKSIKRN